jgi:hypothetical protein
MGTTFTKLRDRLRRDFPDLHIPENAIIYRRYTGRHEREAGIWCWFIPGSGVGSTFTATECLKAKRLEYKRPFTGWLSVQGDAEIFAYDR